MILEILAFIVGLVYGYVNPRKEERWELFKKDCVRDNSGDYLWCYRFFRGWTALLYGWCNRDIYKCGIPRDYIHYWYVCR
ncbi:hypothetical protein C5S31_08430 [ANME-1 cluster archaeon GoMg2]|nr:hypothetical protein [ANME-1 cluster archaeon GoMg2]